MKRSLLAVGLTAVMVASLIAASAQAGAVSLDLEGPEEVTRGQTVTYNATVDATEDATVDNYTLRFVTTKTNESVNATFAPNGTVLDFEPDRGVVGNHGINVNQLNRTLNVTRLGETPDAGYGYGYDAASDRAASGAEHDYRIEFTSNAFVPGGTYALQLNATTSDGEEFSSNRTEFDAVRGGPDAGPARGR